MNIVRVTHRLVAVINDLRDKVTFLGKLISEGNKPLTSLRQSIDDIKEGFNSLSDKETYEFLKGDTVDLIASMSGKVFGLVTISDTVYNMYGSTGIQLLPALIPSESSPPTQALLDDLDALDKQIRELRESIELPADLIKQYNSQV